MKTILRKAIPADLEEIQQVFVGAIKNICSGDYTPPQIEAWASSIENIERWKRLISNQFTLVATQDDQIVGFAALDDGDYLDFLFVHSDHQRKGIATKLFDELKLESLRRGFFKLHSDVSLTARPFFEAKQFKLVKENKKEINGVFLTNYRMQEQ